MSHEIPGRPWESLGTDVFSINNKHYLCIVDYQGKFPLMKGAQCRYSNEKPVRLFFAEHGLLCKIVSDTGSNFILEKFENFYK